MKKLRTKNSTLCVSTTKRQKPDNQAFVVLLIRIHLYQTTQNVKPVTIKDNILRHKSRDFAALIISLLALTEKSILANPSICRKALPDASRKHGN